MLNPLASIRQNFIIGVIVIIIFSMSCQRLDLKRVMDATTDDVQVTGTTVVAYGTILDVGESSIVGYGHCWSGEPNPSIENYYTDLGIRDTTGNFNSELHSLIPGKVFYIRSYLFNGSEYVYGEEHTFEITSADLRFISQTPESVGLGQIIIQSSTTSLGSINFSSHGHCWSQTDPPTIDDYKTSLGPFGSDSTYLSQINDLTQGVYYIRGYLESDGVIIYTNSIQYESTITVETSETSLNPDNSVAANGKIISLGANPIIDYGHCWSTFNSSPNLNYEHTSLGSTSVLGNFTSNITDLISGRKYYIRAYATDGSKVYYGEIRTFVSN